MPNKKSLEEMIESLALAVKVGFDEVHQKMNAGFSEVKARLNNVEGRLGNVELRLANVETNLARVEFNTSGQEERVFTLEYKVKQIAEKLGFIFKKE